MNVLVEMKGIILYSYFIIFYVIVLLVLIVLNKFLIFKLKYFGDMFYLCYNLKILFIFFLIENFWICF